MYVLLVEKYVILIRVLLLTAPKVSIVLHMFRHPNTLYAVRLATLFAKLLNIYK
jgi:hypothetical protein